VLLVPRMQLNELNMLGLFRSAQLQVGVQQDMRDFRHAVLLFF